VGQASVVSTVASLRATFFAVIVRREALELLAATFRVYTYLRSIKDRVRNVLTLESWPSARRCEVMFVDAPTQGPTSSKPNVEVQPRTIRGSVRRVIRRGPDICSPIAVDFDAKGRLLVVESHTHFRPAELTPARTEARPAFESSEDTDGGRARRSVTPPSLRHHGPRGRRVHPDG